MTNKLTGLALLAHYNEARSKSIYDQLDTIEDAGWIKEDGTPDILGYMNEKAKASMIIV
jgi:hypothetical protein